MAQQDLLQSILQLLGGNQGIKSPVPQDVSPGGINDPTQSGLNNYYQTNYAKEQGAKSNLTQSKLETPILSTPTPTDTPSPTTTPDASSQLPDWFSEKIPGTKTTYQTFWEAINTGQNDIPTPQQLQAIQKVGMHKTQAEIDRLMQHAKDVGADTSTIEKPNVFQQIGNAVNQGVQNVGNTVKTDWNDFVKMATQKAVKAGVPPAILLSQAAIESNRGQSPMAQNKNNYFGYAAYDSNPGAAKSYASPDQSVDDVISWYKSHPDVWANRTSPVGMAHAIKAAGYASDPNYAPKILSTPEFRQNVSSQTSHQPMMPPPITQSQPQSPQQTQRTLPPPVPTHVNPVYQRSFQSPIPQQQMVKPSQAQQQGGSNPFQGIQNAIGGIGNFFSHL